MVANKGIKRKSLGAQIQTPNKSPKLKPEDNSPVKQVQIPLLKKTKTVQAHIPKKTQAKQKKVQDEDVDESEDENISDLGMGDDDSIDGENDDSSIKGEDDTIKDDEDDSAEGAGDDSDIKTTETKIAKPHIVKGNQMDHTSGFVVFVGHLNFETTEAELRQHFKQAGEVVDIKLVSFKNNRSRGFGFVQLKNETAYKKALQLNHSTLGDRQINVEVTEKKSLEKSHDNPRKRPEKKFGVKKAPLKATKGKLITNKGVA